MSKLFQFQVLTNSQIFTVKHTISYVQKDYILDAEYSCRQILSHMQKWSTYLYISVQSEHSDTFLKLKTFCTLTLLQQQQHFVHFSNFLWPFLQKPHQQHQYAEKRNSTQLFFKRSKNRRLALKGLKAKPLTRKSLEWMTVQLAEERTFRHHTGNLRCPEFSLAV